MPKSRVTVSLPNPVPEVSLPSHLAVTLEALIGAKHSGLTTPELQEAGCLNPSRAVSRLRQLGAIVQTQRCGAADLQGVIHERVARYVYLGWARDYAVQNPENRGGN